MTASRRALVAHTSHRVWGAATRKDAETRAHPDAAALKIGEAL